MYQELLNDYPNPAHTWVGTNGRAKKTVIVNYEDVSDIFYELINKDYIDSEAFTSLIERRFPDSYKIEYFGWTQADKDGDYKYYEIFMCIADALSEFEIIDIMNELCIYSDSQQIINHEKEVL